MTREERCDIIGFCAARSGPMKIIAGAGTNDTSGTVLQAQEAQEAGADAVLVVTPYYNRPTKAGLIDHFACVADNVDIPVILYNIPSRTGTALTADTAGELALHPNINGVKEAGPGTAFTSGIMSSCPDELFIWSGNDSETLPLMALGARGVISVASNLIPKEMAELTRLCLLGEYFLASRLHAKYYPLMTSLFMETNPIPVKTALSLMGLCHDEFRLPMCKLREESKDKLLQVMHKFTLI